MRRPRSDILYCTVASLTFPVVHKPFLHHKLEVPIVSSFFTGSIAIPGWHEHSHETVVLVTYLIYTRTVYQSWTGRRLLVSCGSEHLDTDRVF